MIPVTVKRILGAALIASLTACGGSGGTAGTAGNMSSPVANAQSGNVAVLVSDASSEDWACIGVRVLSIALVPQNGGNPVTVFTASAPAPMINLAQLDQLSELLGNVAVPAGSYERAILTVAANQGDVVLTSAADPEAGFAVAPATTIPADMIRIQGAQGTSPNLTVPITVNLQSPLVVAASQNNALDLEFDLAHPAFIVGHTPPGAGGTVWAVDFDGPVRHHRVGQISHLLLRHLYGSVTSVASDGSNLTVTRDLPAIPVSTPETAVATQQMLTIDVDATNGTLFYDLDAKTSAVVKTFAGASDLAGKYVRIASRYQEDGSLIAVRVWVSSDFNKVWISPEGHVLHVDTQNSVLTIANEQGLGVPVQVDAGTQFFFRTPADAIADATPIATGTSLLANHGLVRGFKVHVSVVDPLATTLTASTVDIETATFDGRISGADASGFVDTRTFHTATDDYSVQLPFIAATTANGQDASGSPVSGFKWWNFTYPTLADTGSNAIADFDAAADGAASFGGTAPAVPVWGASRAIWGDPANPQGWAVRDTVLLPAPLPLGSVVGGLTSGVFTMTVAGAANPVSVQVATTGGSATLAYQVDWTNGVLTVSPVDVSTPAGLVTLTSGLASGAPVKVYAIPQSDGQLRAYVVLYYTGTAPAG